MDVELDYKESWVPKNWCFWTVVLEKTLESPLDCKEIQPVHPKGDQSWVFTGRTDVEAETLVLWPPDAKSWLIGKDPDLEWLGKDSKGTIEDEMAGWHHQLDGHGFGWTLGAGDGQGGLACCGSGGHKESDMLSDWTELNFNHYNDLCDNKANRKLQGTQIKLHVSVHQKWSLLWIWCLLKFWETYFKWYRYSKLHT